MKAHRVHRRIEFGDTDMAGIVHFANFFRFMEAAETDFLRSRGHTVSWVENQRKYGFPRVSASCTYLKPARFEDLLDIDVTVDKIGEKSICYRFDFSRAGEAIATGSIVCVFCSASESGFQSLSIPEAIRADLLL